MNPDDPIVQTVTKRLIAELGSPIDQDSSEPPDPFFVKLAMAVLFDLAKSGVRMVHPDDVLKSETDTETGTINLVLTADA